MTVREFQAKIAAIYGPTNKSHNHNHDFFFSYLQRTISSGFKKIRYGADPSEKFAKSITYLLGLCELCHIDLQDSFLSRFPNCCPYCLITPCQCHRTNKKSALRIEQRKYSDELMWKRNGLDNEIANTHVTVDFDYFADIIERVYPFNRMAWKLKHGPEFHIEKCFEELGEIQEAYSTFLSRKENPEYLLQVKEEVCDLLAWVLSAWKLQCPDVEITAYLERMYGRGCPSCNEDVCTCKSRHNSADMLWSKAEIESIYILLKKLEGTGDEELEELLKAFEDALATNSNSAYKVCINKTIKYLSGNNRSVADKRVDDINNVLEIYKTKI